MSRRILQKICSSREIETPVQTLESNRKFNMRLYQTTALLLCAATVVYSAKEDRSGSKIRLDSSIRFVQFAERGSLVDMMDLLYDEQHGIHDRVVSEVVVNV